MFIAPYCCCQAVRSLEHEKSQLHERLLQAQAFIACLQQRPGGSGSCSQQQQQKYPDTPVLNTAMTPGPTPGAAQHSSGHPSASAAAAVQPGQAQTAVEAATTAAGAHTGAAEGTAGGFGGFVTPVKQLSNPLFDLPPTPASDAPAAAAGTAHVASFAASPILAAAAAALSSCTGKQQQQQIQWNAASHELQHVQQEQLGLRQEIIKAKSALADIAGQLRASIGTSASVPASAARSTGSSSHSSCKYAGAVGVVSSKAASSGAAASASRFGSSRTSSNCSSQGSAAGAEPGAKSSQVPAPSRPPAAFQQRGRRPESLNSAVQEAAATTAGSQSLEPVQVVGSSSHYPLQQQQQQHSTGSVSAERQDFTFPCLDVGAQRPQLLNPRAAHSAPIATAAITSPCESTGSVGSSSNSRHGSQGVREREQAAAAVAASIARMLEQQHTAAGVLQREQQHKQDEQQPDAAKSSSTRACTQSCNQANNASSATASGSKAKASGSLSLSQLIADAESVSLEYGMSPGGCAAVHDTASTCTPPQPRQAQAPATAGAGTQGQWQLQAAAATGQQQSQQQLDAAAAAAAAIAKAFAAPTPGYCGPATESWATTAVSHEGSVCFDRHDSGQEGQQHLLQTPCSAAAAESGTCSRQGTPCESVGDSDVDWLLLQQQEQERLMHERLVDCLADTPGSAASSAGGGRTAAAARQWLMQQQQQPGLLPLVGYGTGDVTPSPASVGAADLQSAVRPAAAYGSGAVAIDPSSSPLSMHAAATPLGAERVASNIVMSPHEDDQDSPWCGNQQQQRSLLKPSFVTPTVIADQRAAAALREPYSHATEDDATSGTRKADEQEQGTATAAADENQLLVALAAAAVTSSLATGTAAEAPGQVPDGAAADDCMQTPAASAAVAAAAAGQTGELSALQSAASALLASISPAGLISPGQVVPADVLKYVTPEWMRQLRQRCQQGTLQVQQLRTQLGLATPSTTIAAQPAQQQEGSGQPPEPHHHLATPSAAGASASQQQQQQEQGAVDVQQLRRQLGLGAPSATEVATSQNAQQQEQQWQEATQQVQQLCSQLGLATPSASEVPADWPQQQDTPVAGPGENLPGEAGSAVSQSRSMRTPAEGSAAAAIALTGGILGQSTSAASARSNINKLRRRAMVQAAAAAGTPAVTGADCASETLGAASVQRSASPAGLEGAFAALVAAEAATGDLSIERNDSHGSLSRYMTQQQQVVSQNASGPNSRCDSGHLPSRPDCPTPGSVYSVASGRDSASPDVLLAGLSSSRRMARQLQLQLQSQLEQGLRMRTASMPALTGQGEPLPGQRLSEDGGDQEVWVEHGAAAADSSSSSWVQDPAARAAEEDAGTVVAADLEDKGAGEVMLQTPQRNAASQVCNLHSVEAAAAAVAAAAASSPLTPGATLDAEAESCLLAGSGQGKAPAAAAAAAASPFTPGAVLNASAESRLLSPSMDLQRVFDEAEGGAGEGGVGCGVASGATAAVAGDSHQATATGVDSPAARTHSDDPIRAHQLISLTAGTLTATTSVRAGSTGSASDDQAEVGCATSAAAPASTAGEPPAAAVASPSAVAHPVSAIKAHQLSSFTATATTDVRAGSSTPASDARAAAGCSTAAAAAEASTSHLSSVSEATNPSLSSWAAPGAAASHAIVHCCGAAAGSPSSSVAAAALSSCRADPERITLGDSPTGTRQTGRAPAGTAAAADGAIPVGQLRVTGGSVDSGSVDSSGGPNFAGAAASGASASDAATPSCSTSCAMPSVNLGDSPQPCCEEQEGVQAVPEAAGLSSAADESSSSSSSLRNAVVTAPIVPASSSTSAAGNSCMYATPEGAPDSPGISSSAAGSGQQMFYTAMQHTARSTGGAAARRPVSASGIVAFGGFDIGRGHGTDTSSNAARDTEEAAAAELAADQAPINKHQSSPDDKSQLLLHLLASPQGSGMASESAAELTATDAEQTSLLQQLLASPDGSPWPATAKAASGGHVGVSSAPQHAVSNLTAAESAAAADSGVDIMSHPVSVSITPAAESVASGSSSVAAHSQLQPVGRSKASSARAALSSSACAVEASSGAVGHSSVSAFSSCAVQQQQPPAKEVQRPTSAPAAAQARASGGGSTAHCMAKRSHTPGCSSSSASSGMPVGVSLAAAQLVSPTLSELGFIDAPTAGDYSKYETEQQLQEQEQQEARVAGGDLAGMTFEQRLALLCASSDDSEGDHHAEEDAVSSRAGDLGQQQQTEEAEEQADTTAHMVQVAVSPAAAALRLAHGASSSSSSAPQAAQHVQRQQPAGRDAEQIGSCTPVLPAYLASRATQTSPLLAEAATQVGAGKRWEHSGQACVKCISDIAL